MVLKGYKTINEICSAETEVKHSRFIATVCPCKTEKEATDFIAAMRKKYWDARHNVYAFSIRENSTKRFSDDGEPHSTAGLPVMEVINHSEVTDIAIVVTRYFGGILLGTGGLVRAYSEAARLALENAEIVTILPAKSFEIKCDYGDYDPLLKLLETFGVKVISTDFAHNVVLKLVVKAELYDDLLLKCTDKFCARIPFSDTEDIFMGF